MERIRETTWNMSENFNSKYIKTGRNIKILERLSIVFMIGYFIFPQYFGINLPGFDLTLQRILIIIYFIYILEQKQRIFRIYSIMKENILTPYILIFLFVLLYTAVFRRHLGTFMYSFIEFVAFYITIYIIRDVLGVKRTVKLIIIFAYILCVLGLLEYLMGRSPFSYLETIKGLYTGGAVRSGSYRIMGPANHSLAYGLILITLVPLTCSDIEMSNICIFRRPLLFVLLAMNILLTGSRSTLAVFGLEIILLFIFSSRVEKKKTILLFLVLFFLLTVFVVIFRNTGMGRYILLQFSSVIDELLGTQYALNYGADINTLYNSSTYRSLLPEIFKLDWLNPIVGRGSGYVFTWYYNGYYIKSIDNYYVATYIRYAYPGTVAYILFMIRIFGDIIFFTFKKSSNFSKALLVGISCYFINLWWLDTLQTIKYVYILVAIYLAFKDEFFVIEGKEND